MNYWMFKTADSHRTLKTSPSAFQIAEACMTVGKWGIGDQTPNAFNMKAGDRVLIYAGGKRPGGGQFLARAKILAGTTSDRFEISETIWPLSVRLFQIKRFALPVPMSEVREKLSFYKRIRNKAKWGVVMMGGVRRITGNDFALVLGIEGKI